MKSKKIKLKSNVACLVMGIEHQPVNNVVWRKRTELKANAYNPNHVPPPELLLLKTSILQDGWTQPIVIREDFEIVDGFHRWLVSEDKEISIMTDGLVPTAMLKNISKAHQIMSTIRHNRARGSHLVKGMSNIVHTLIEEYKKSPEEVIKLLSMEPEEVERLLDNGNMLKRGARNKEFGKAWTPISRKNKKIIEDNLPEQVKGEEKTRY